MKTVVALTLCLLLAAPLLAKEEGPLPTAVKAFADGEYEKALEALEKIGADHADRPRADYLKGEAELALGRAKDALASFRAVLAKRPKAVPAMTGVGRALLALGRAVEAVTETRKAVKAAPKDAAAHRTLGLALAAAGKPDDAEKSLAKSWKLDRKDPLTARAYVSLLLDRKAIPEAKAVASRLRKGRPDHPMGPVLTGLAFDREGKDDEALRYYEAAIAKDDGFLDAHKNLAILCHTVNPLYRDTERTKKALEHYRRYFELGGDDPKLEQLYKQFKSFWEQYGGGR